MAIKYESEKQRTNNINKEHVLACPYSGCKTMCEQAHTGHGGEYIKVNPRGANELIICSVIVFPVFLHFCKL